VEKFGDPRKKNAVLRQLSFVRAKFFQEVGDFLACIFSRMDEFDVFGPLRLDSSFPVRP
jgi:hypothetical protein